MAGWPISTRGRYTETPNSALSAVGFKSPQPTGGFGDALRWIGNAVRGNAEMGAGAPVGMLGIGSSQLTGGQYQSIMTGGNRFIPGGGAQPQQQEAPTSRFRSDLVPKTSQEWATYDARTRLNPRNAPLGRAMPPGAGQDIVQDFWQEQYDRYIAGMTAEEDSIKAGYSAALDAAEDQLGDLRAAAAAVGLPFDEYMATRKGIGAGVGDVEAMQGTLVPEISKIYDDAEGEVKETLKRINMNFGPQVTSQITTRLRDMQSTMEDVIRTDETAVDLLHEKTGQYAKAMAQAAYSGDMYAALDAETRINAQLDDAIEKTQEEIARQKEAMAAAIRAAQDRFAAGYEWQQPEYEQVVLDSINEYFLNNNVPEHERAAAMQAFEQLRADPSNTLDEPSWRRGVTEYMNVGILSTLGFGADAIQARIDASQNPAIRSFLENTDLASALQKGQTVTFKQAMIDSGFSEAEATQIVRAGTKNADKYQTLQSPEYNHLRNMFGIRNQVRTDWESIVSNFGPKVTDDQIFRAPDGYINPVAGGAKYSNDWGNPRGGGTRRHEGTDMFAPKGTPVLSPVNGVVKSIDYGNLGGKYVKITDGNGNVHYLAHLDTQSRNIAVGQRVKAGTVVGTVGNTGNARTTPPHLHYGIYTSKGATNPYNWLKNTQR